MARYFNSVESVISGEVGRLLDGRDFDDAKWQLRPGEHLYALCDRLIFRQVVCVDGRDDFDDFYGQYASGRLISFDLLALSEEEHRQAG